MSDFTQNLSHFRYAESLPYAVFLTCSERVCHCCRHLLRSLSHFCCAESLSCAVSLTYSESLSRLQTLVAEFLSLSLCRVQLQSLSLAVRESVTVADTCCGVSLTSVIQSLSDLQSLSFFRIKQIREGFAEGLWCG